MKVYPEERKGSPQSNSSKAALGEEESSKSRKLDRSLHFPPAPRARATGSTMEVAATVDASAALSLVDGAEAKEADDLLDTLVRMASRLCPEPRVQVHDQVQDEIQDEVQDQVHDQVDGPQNGLLAKPAR